MTDRKEDWIYIIKPNGEERIASPAFIANLLKEHLNIPSAWNHATEHLRKEVCDLQDFVKELLVPEAKEVIINFLRENPDAKTRDLNATGKWRKRLYWPAWWTARNQLEEEGIMVPTSHGKGRNRTWNLNELGAKSHETRYLCDEGCEAPCKFAPKDSKACLDWQTELKKGAKKDVAES